MSGALHVQALLEASAHEVPSAPRLRRPGRLPGRLALVLLLAALAWAGASWACAGRVPRGTSVAGVQLGGLHREAAVAALTTGLASAQTAPVAVRVGGRTASVDPAGAGLHLDAAATADAVIGRVGSPRSLWRAAVGGGSPEPVSTVDEAAMATTLRSLATRTDVAPVEGGITFTAGRPALVEPAPGTALRRDAASALLRREWLTARTPLALPTRPLHPTVDHDAVVTAERDLAGPATAGPITVVAGTEHVVLAPATFTRAVHLVPSSGALALVVDGAALADAVVAADGAAVTAPVDAALTTGGGPGVPTVVPAVDGTRIDTAALAAAASTALAGTTEQARTVTAALVPAPAATSTDEVTGLGVSALLADETTALTADPDRTQDVTTAAAALDGTIVGPGQALSLAQVLGMPTAQAGYTAAGVISDGGLTSSFAAGVPQVASTLYGAAMAAGLTATDRTAHPWYDPRYPAGVDATVDLPAVDLVVTNDSSTAVLVAAWVDDALHVRVWGTHDVDVAQVTGPRTDVDPAGTRVDASASCVPETGSDGFTVTVTRTLTRAGDAVGSDAATTTYARHDAVVCTGPGLSGAPPPVAVGD